MSQKRCILPVVAAAIHLCAAQDRPSIPYRIAKTHEISPHRSVIPVEGARGGLYRLWLQLVVSPVGAVLSVEPHGSPASLAFWPKVESEVRQWRFTPFEEDGRAVAATIEEFVGFDPPEKLPTRRVPAPVITPQSKVAITLERTECYGSCPAYIVHLTTEGIVFEGRSSVVAKGKHTDRADPDQVRKLAAKFVDADFYSMDPSYVASITDNPAFILSVSIDGVEKNLRDYVGTSVGMPAIVRELESDVDRIARTERWNAGNNGLVSALRAETFDFRSPAAQFMLKDAAWRGELQTVQELLAAGVVVTVPGAKTKEGNLLEETRHLGWLTAGSAHADVLKLLLDAGASKNDQQDKDQALAHAASVGALAPVRMLIAYGADPRADLPAGSSPTPLIGAAEACNADVLREILRFHPDLEARATQGATALITAVINSRGSDRPGARAECIRALAQAGANVNARDNRGNTALHQSYTLEVQTALLEMGADVNARNDEGETPIFKVVNADAIPLFLTHGVDLTVRNNRGQTVLEAIARSRPPAYRQALRDAIDQAKQH